MTDTSGASPFARVTLKNGITGADYVPLFTPLGSHSQAVYANIQANLKTWVEKAHKRS